MNIKYIWRYFVFHKEPHNICLKYLIQVDFHLVACNWSDRVNVSLIMSAQLTILKNYVNTVCRGISFVGLKNNYMTSGFFSSFYLFIYLFVFLNTHIYGLLRLISKCINTLVQFKLRSSRLEIDFELFCLYPHTNPMNK